MAITTGNLAGLNWNEDAASDAESVYTGNAPMKNINIDVLPQIYEPRYAAQPYNPHLGFYSNRQQTQFAPDWSYQPTNRAYNMRDVAGEVGEYGERPGQGYNEEMYTPKSKGFNLWDFLPGKAVYEGLGAMLPKMDPRQVALRDFYGYDNVGRVPTGLMAGYNPVSGGFLNKVTGGKFGEPTNYGLQRAYDKRMSTIEKTLGKKYGLSDAQIQDVYAGSLDEEDQYGSQLFKRLRDLKAAKAAELAMLQKVQTEGQGGTTIVPPDTGGKGDWITKKGSYTPPADPGTKGSWYPGGTYSGQGANAGNNPGMNQGGGGYKGAGTSGSYAAGPNPGSSGYGPWKKRDGGRIGYQNGELVEQETDFIQGPQGGEEFQETVVEGQEQPSREQLEALAMEIFQLPLEELDDQQLLVVYQEAMQGQPMEEAVQEDEVQFAAQGGLAGLL